MVDLRRIDEVTVYKLILNFTIKMRKKKGVFTQIEYTNPAGQ